MPRQKEIGILQHKLVRIIADSLLRIFQLLLSGNEHRIVFSQPPGQEIINLG